MAGTGVGALAAWQELRFAGRPAAQAGMCTHPSVRGLLACMLCHPPPAGLAGGACNQQQLAAGDALRALRHHVAVARALPQPVLTEEAMALLTAYFQHLRTSEGAQRGVLASLARVAAASARLRHSARVEALSDAALAVACVEEKLLVAGASPLLWPRWREELQRCTELHECLRGLAEDCASGLGLGGGCGGAAVAAGAAWAGQAEE